MFCAACFISMTADKKPESPKKEEDKASSDAYEVLKVTITDEGTEL